MIRRLADGRSSFVSYGGRSRPTRLLRPDPRVRVVCQAATATRRAHRRQTRSGLIVDPRHPFIRPAPPGGQAHGVSVGILPHAVCPGGAAIAESARHHERALRADRRFSGSSVAPASEASAVIRCAPARRTRDGDDPCRTPVSCSVSAPSTPRRAVVRYPATQASWARIASTPNAGSVATTQIRGRSLTLVPASRPSSR